MKTLITQSLSTYQIAALLLFCASFLVQMGYYLIYFRRFVSYKPKFQTDSVVPISVIICSRNEGIALEKNLPYFLEQTHPNYEVIVVDDCSSDETEMVIKRFQQQYKHLRSTTIHPDPKFKHSKKLALTIGIKASKNEHLIFSNPHCKPVSRNWLQQMQQQFTPNVKILLGYTNVPYRKGFGAQLMRYDSWFNQFKAFSFALSGKSFSGNGNNLGFKKQDFFAIKGYSGHAHLEAGYDHLIVKGLGKENGAGICISPESKIENLHAHPVKNWIEEYRTYYTSRKFYSRRFRFLLDLEPVSRILFHGSFFLLLIPGPILTFSASLYLIRLILFLTFIKIASRHLKEEKLFLSSYINDVLVVFVKLYFFATNRIFSRKY